MAKSKKLQVSYRRMRWFRCGESTDIVTHIECSVGDIPPKHHHKKRSSRTKTPSSSHSSSSDSSDSSVSNESVANNSTPKETVEKKRKRKVSFSDVDKVYDRSKIQEPDHSQLYRPICLRHHSQTPWIVTHYYTVGSSQPYLIHTYIPVNHRRYMPVSVY